MITNCLAEYAHLTITVAEIERDIGRKSSIFHIPLHSTPPLGGSRRNIATPFGMEKLEWCGYQMVKKFKDIFIRFGATQERDGRTDGQTPGDGNSRAMHSIARQKPLHIGKKSVLTLCLPCVALP